MADEPRRSGRATKGQHTKDRDGTEDAPATKKKGKGKGSKGKVVEEEVEEVEEAAEEIIRCVCGQYEEEEDVPRAMICCDNCSAWQHNGCMGLPEDYEADNYFCEQCKPETHKELVAAIARGEKPWEASAEAKKAEKGKKKGGRKGRKSGGTRASEAAAPVASQEPEEPTPQPTPQPTPVAATGQKRKLEESPAAPEIKNKKVRGTPAVDTNGSKPTPPAEDQTPAPAPAAAPVSVERKPSQSSTPSRQASKSEPASGPAIVSDIKELSNPTRKGAAQSLIKLIEQQVKELVKQGQYTLPSGSSIQNVASQTGLRVEHALYHIQAGGSGEPNDAYKQQLRAITFNVKKNHALGARLLQGDLTPHKLANMDPTDMASEEQKRKDAAIMKEMEKQHTIIEQEGPRIRRTHKGEEYVDESRQVAAESVTSNAPVRKPSTAEHDGDVKSPDQTIKSPTKPSRPSVDSARRQSSANFDIDKVWSNVANSPTGGGDGDGPRFGELPLQQSPVISARDPSVPGTKADADIDELLKDEEAESPPYSPKDTTENDGTIWQGYVNGGSLGKFHISAKHAAGATPDSETLRMTYHQLLPDTIVIAGRIQPSKAEEYLCGLEYSNTSDLVIVYMPEPAKDTPDQIQFEKFFRYFKSKDRFGVGTPHPIPAVKDVYLIPLEAGQELPTFVKKLETDFPDPTRERMLLIPIVIKNSELPHNLAGTSVASPGGVPIAQTPMTPLDGTFDSHQTSSYSQSPAPGHYGLNGTPQIPGSNSATPHPYPTPGPQSQPPYPPQPQFNPILQQQQQPSPAVLNAQRVLGPLATAPAVVQLCAQVPTAGEHEFGVIREILEKNPEAANSLDVLTGMLQHFSAAQK
ncbi:hypothetical protein LTR84_004616 [Exophiala bonariae]|uniref:Transcription factor BYE1 n=1 Tax=Exophiala bonariae TaxID=1690606 RepID=A0AAV9NN53_9EURO|nr:hypothetical protein LTR84_004616 [Exophiala bonariae]